MNAPVGVHRLAPRSEFVVIISSSDRDHAHLRSVLHRGGWRTTHARTFREAVSLLEQACVVLCQPELADGDWRVAAGLLGASPGAPVLIVITPQPWKGLSEEVLRRGGYDVLCAPFRAPEVLRSVNSAYKCYQAEQQIVEECSRCNAARSLVSGVP